MNRKIALSLVAAAVLAGPAGAQSLPGVSDRETTIPYARNGIREFHFGNGDVMFVRDRTNHWYRLELNGGCLSNGFNGATSAAFTANGANRIDTSSKVVFANSGRTCLVDSIRRSGAPPQVNSKSPVTLD